MAGNLHKRGSGLRSSFLHPLSLLDMVVGSKQKGMFRIQEAIPVLPLHSMVSDPLKSAVCMFLAEVLNHTYIESQPDPNQFEYVENALKFLELSETCPPDFHIIFLWKLSRILGICPRNNFHNEEAPKFDLVNGCFVSNGVYGQEICPLPLSALVSNALDSDFSASVGISGSLKLRRELLDLTIQYFTYHLGWKHEIKSHIVLQEVFQD
ncbi:MAG: hypothetical protein CVU05_13275, partial [Bacteroidetes bacterium HGW-Bacteroidetes-21]